MLSKRYESTEVDRRTWLHVTSVTFWSISSDTHEVLEIEKAPRVKFKLISQEKTRHVRENWSQQLEHKQVQKKGDGIRRGFVV